MNLSEWERSVLYTHYLEEAKEHLRGGGDVLTANQARDAIKRAALALDRAQEFDSGEDGPL
jgi:hypothetical protein